MGHVIFPVCVLRRSVLWKGGDKALEGELNFRPRVMNIVEDIGDLIRKGKPFAIFNECGVRAGESCAKLLVKTKRWSGITWSLARPTSRQTFFFRW